jgi:hypothetical protein
MEVSEFLKPTATVRKVEVDLLQRYVIHLQDGKTVVVQSPIQATQLGQVESESVAVVETENESGNDPSLAGVGLGNFKQAAQGGFTLFSDSGKTPCAIGLFLKQFLQKRGCTFRDIHAQDPSSIWLSVIVSPSC